MAFSQQCLAELLADHAGTASDEDLHITSREISIVGARLIGRWLSIALQAALLQQPIEPNKPTCSITAPAAFQPAIFRTEACSWDQARCVRRCRTAPVFPQS